MRLACSPRDVEIPVHQRLSRFRVKKMIGGCAGQMRRGRPVRKWNARRRTRNFKLKFKRDIEGRGSGLSHLGLFGRVPRILICLVACFDLPVWVEQGQGGSKLTSALGVHSFP